jgi:F-type H+-transporting ATPase subunit a
MKYELNFCSPLEQFEITLPLLFNINGFQIGFFITNISIFFSISCFLICFSFFLSGITLSNYLTSVLSLIYSFVSNLSKINAKNPEFFIFYLFLFNLILVNNLIGMIPYSFTTTSSALITFFLSFGSFFGICLVGFDYLGFDFFRLFLPSGCPLRILKLLIFIETVSYLIRAFSLAIRLFANMVSGHSLLKILASFA